MYKRQQLSAKDALAAQLEYEHDIASPTPPWQPLWAGATSGLAFLLGSLVPLLITIFAPVKIEVWAIVLAVVVSLSLTSWLAARTGRMSLSRTLARSLGVGIGTMAISYTVGLLVLCCSASPCRPSHPRIRRIARRPADIRRTDRRYCATWACLFCTSGWL